MTKYVSTITHQEHAILYVDCANQGIDGMLEAMDEMLQHVLAKPHGEKSLILLDMRNTPSSMQVNQKGRDIVEAARRAGYPEMPTAIVGFTGPQKLVTQMFASLRNPDTLFVANTVDEAKEWLVKH